MKKIFVFLFLMVVSFVAKSQYPITQNLGADSTLIYIKGAARTVGGFINGVYTDTAAANLTRIRQYQAAQIFTLNDSAIWFRMPGANKWVRIMPATPPSPNVDTAYWSLNGNYVADRVATPRLGTTSYHELNMITNDTIRATISADGIQRVSGGQYRALVIDTTIGANGYLGYMDNGTGTINSDSLNNYWRLTGNSKPVALPDTSKILGTIDTSSIYFRTNNYIAGYIKNAEPLAPYYMRGTGAQGVAFGSHAGENGFRGQWANTNTLIGTYAGRFTRSSANIFVGFHAGYLHTFGGANGGRNVAIGEWAMNNGYRAYDNVAVGTFALNNNWRGISNTGVGRDAFKSSSDANGLVGVGAYTGLYNSTGVKKVVITNSGSGYTTATITISAPGWSANGGNCSEQATATAVIQGGQIVDAIITNPGCGYWVAADSLRELGLSIDWPAQTVTITGDGVGATASLEFINNWANTYVGGTSGVYRRFSAYETAIGSESAGASRYKDTANTFLGYQADVSSSVSLDSNIHRSTAVGQNAKVTQSDQMVLGATTQKDINAYGFLNLFNTTGNSPTIGTNINRSLWFRTNSTNRIELDSLGRLFIGQRPSYYNLLGTGHGFNYRNTFAIFDVNSLAIFGRVTSETLSVLNVIDSVTGYTPFRIPISAMSTPMSAGEYSTFHFGKALTQGQSGALSYVYSGANSPENKVALGFYANFQMWITNSGRFGFGTSVPSYGFHINKQIGVNKDSIPITTGKLWYSVVDTATGQVMRQLLPATGVDSIWRVPGIDSFYHRIAGVTKAIKDSTGGGTYTAGNGLTLSGSQFKLGGTITENTTINTGQYTVSFNANTTASANGRYTLYSLNTGAHSSSGISTAGIWINNAHTGTNSTNIAAQFQAQNGTNNYAILAPFGKVGIGTTAPDSIFQVNGGVKIVNGTQGAGKELYSDENGGLIFAYDTVTLANFGAGARIASDTAAFTDSTIYGSFYNDGSDTLVITKIWAVMNGGSGDTLGVQIYYNDSLNVIGSAVATSTLPVNSYTVGNSTTTLTNPKIPPGNWVWCKSPTVVAGRKPDFLSVSIIGYKKRRL